MRETGKYDFTETDQVMDQLRAQLQADREAAAGVTEGEQKAAALDTAPLLSETAATEKKARKKPRRTPKKIPESPVFKEDYSVLEEKKKRAAALAADEGKDLNWSRLGEPNRQPAHKKQAAPPRDHTLTASTPAPAPHTEAGVHREGSVAAALAAHTRGKGVTAVDRTEETADVTVEGLLQDIFGAGAGGSGADAWLGDEQKGAKRADKKASKDAAEPLSAFDPKLELGGVKVVLPPEAEAENAAKEAPKTPDVPPRQDTERDDLPEELFAAFSVRRQKEGALPKPSLTRLSAEKMAFKRSLEEADDEFELLLDLDYEDELGEAIGFEKILAYHERRINGKTRPSGARRSRKRGKVAGHLFEYTSHAHDIALSKFYTKQRRRHIIDLVMVLLLTLLLAVYERSAVILSFMNELVGERAYGLYLSVGVLLFLAAVILLRRHLIAGLVQFWHFTPTNASVAVVTVILTLLYHGMLFFVAEDGTMMLYLSPTMVALSLLALSNLFDWHREFSAFRVVSSKHQKYALLPRVSVGNREADAKKRLSQPEQREAVWYVRPVGFVRNYFANTEKRSDHRRTMGATLLFVAALACSFSLYTLALGGTMQTAVHTAFVTFLLTAPTVSILTTSLPMFLATVLCLKRKSAIIGEGPVFEGGGKTKLVLPDDECFHPMPHEQFELVKSCDAERAAVQIRALLDKIGSPLAATVYVPHEQLLSPETVTLTEVDELGVAAVISGERKTPVLLGSVEYLQKYGIRVSPKKDGRYDELCRNMLCVAVNNRLTALFIARYRPMSDMRTLADRLSAEQLQLVIRSKDPGIHDQMLKELFAEANIPPQVMKPLAAEADITAERVDATVVSIGSAREAASAFAVCRRIRRAVRRGTLWQSVSMILGTLFAAALVFFGRIGAVAPLATALYPVCFGGLQWLTSHLTLREKNENE